MGSEEDQGGVASESLTEEVAAIKGTNTRKEGEGGEGGGGGEEGGKVGRRRGKKRGRGGGGREGGR